MAGRQPLDGGGNTRVEAAATDPLGLLAAVAVVLVVAGFTGFRRRDLAV